MLRRLSLLSLTALTLALPARAQKAQVVRFVTADDVVIVATFHPAATADAPVVILLHGLGQNRGEWAKFIALLQTNGMAALALDLRGHGQSTRRITAEGVEPVDFLKFTPRDYQSFLLDVNAAVEWLTKQPGFNARRVGLLGADMGANVALRYAALNEDLAAVALLSPSINNQGVRTDDIATQIGSVPLRIVVSQYDPLPFESCKHLLELRRAASPTTDPRELVTCTGYLHGTAMLARVQGLPELLVQWLGERLGGTRAPSSPSKRPAKK